MFAKKGKVSIGSIFQISYALVTTVLKNAFRFLFNSHLAFNKKKG